jgi:hypothetical protein
MMVYLTTTRRIKLFMHMESVMKTNIPGDTDHEFGTFPSDRAWHTLGYIIRHTGNTSTSKTTVKMYLDGQ